MTPRDPYQILGVERNASDAAIRKAYKKLARRHHPDVNPGDKAAEERFKEISEAYAVLSDKDKRRAYDQFGHAGAGGAAGGARGGAGSVSWEDLGGFGFGVGGGSDAGGGLGDLFARIFGGQAHAGRSGAGPRARSGESLETVVRIPFLDALRGLTMPISVSRRVACGTCGGRGGRPGSEEVACSVCGGSGQVAMRRGAMSVQTNCGACAGRGRVAPRDCAACGGDGRQESRETLQVKIPPGVARGARLKLAGKGNESASGGRAGDLLVTVQVEPHPVFERRGDNIYCTVPVTVTEAALGARIEVPTVDGVSRLSVPPGTQSGQRLRLRGKGAPSRRGGRGDQYVEIRVLVPRVDDPEDRELLERLASRLEAAPREELLRRAR